MNKSDSKYLNTAIKMDQAFLTLLDKKDFEFITVKEICQEAGVNRSTFYLHYETINDLLIESINYMNDQFLEFFPKGENRVDQRVHTDNLGELYLITDQYLNPYLNYIREHKRVFQTARRKSSTLGLKDHFDEMFESVLRPILDRFHIAPREQRYVAKYYIGGIMSVLNEWIANGCEDENELIIKIIKNHIGRPGRKQEDE